MLFARVIMAVAFRDTIPRSGWENARMPDTTPEAAPPGIDTSRPHPARMYDYFIGGKNHFAADRETAEKMLAAAPGARTGARENRAFLGRAVQYLTAEAGIRQFLDIGTGLPATDSVHEVAQAIDQAARVAYVDNDRCKSGCAHTPGSGAKPHALRATLAGR
jgi:S-adenosyl methyltransferase